MCPWKLFINEAADDTVASAIGAGIGQIGLHTCGRPHVNADQGTFSVARCSGDT